jgi:hypothetical protein
MAFEKQKVMPKRSILMKATLKISVHSAPFGHSTPSIPLRAQLLQQRRPGISGIRI